jgi:hypothetical protein
VENPILRLPVSLRLTMLGLALFAVLGRPIHSIWCETHQVGHQLAELGHHEFREESRLEHLLDAQHEHGGHGQLHSDDGGFLADTATVVMLPVVQFVAVLNPLEVVLPDPVQRASVPFRPPIT